jgi:hypothetical protein
MEAIRMSKARAIGTRWESAIVDYLRQWWPAVERRAMHGANDKGDIAGLPGVVIEAKSVKTITLAAFVDEAKVEARNAGANIGAVWIKRRGKTSPADGYVVMDGYTFAFLLDEAGYR